MDAGISPGPVEGETDMAAIYDLTGNVITVGLHGCKVRDEAIQIARWIAKDKDESVHLEDDDGDWIVHPDGTCDPLADAQSPQ